MLIIVVSRGVKFSHDAHKFHVIPYFWPVLGLLRHVEQRAKQALAHVLCDMHDIKAMSTGDSGIPNPRKQTSFSIPSSTAESCFFSFPTRGTLPKFSTSCRFL